MNARIISALVLALLGVEGFFIGKVEAKKSIIFYLSAEFKTTTYVSGHKQDTSIYPATAVLGDRGKEGSFNENTGTYRVDKEWTNTQFNILSEVHAMATLHRSNPKLLSGKYHFAEDDKDPGDFYQLDRRLELLNNIQIPNLPELSTDTEYRFEKTGEELCSNLYYFDYRRGNETHHTETEINSCNSDTRLTVIVELDEPFYDGKPILEAPETVKFGVRDNRKEINIKNIGSGDLYIWEMNLYEIIEPPLFTLEGTTCLSRSIAPDEGCVAAVRLAHHPYKECSAMLWINSNGSGDSTFSILLYALPVNDWSAPAINLLLQDRR